MADADTALDDETLAQTGMADLGTWLAGMRVKQQRRDPIWPTSNPVGTQQLVDYRGWDQPSPPPSFNMLQPLGAAPDPGNALLAPAPNTEYGSVLPYARDTTTGDLRLALPSSARNWLQGVYDLSQGPRTGTVTPEGTAALFSLVDPAARPQENLLSAFGGSQRAIREAAIAARAEPANLLDRVVANTGSATPLADTPILRGIVSDGVRDTDRVSTRIPTAAPPKGVPASGVVDPHTTNNLNIGIDASQASPDAYANNGMYLRDGDFPDLPVKGMRNHANITDTAINHMADNLVWLHDQMVDTHGQSVVDRAANWYDGAHQIVMNLAAQTGYSPGQIAGVMASLSPQKDWYQNADLGDRVIDIIKNGQGLTFTPEMAQWGRDYVAQKQAEFAKDQAKGKDITKKLAGLDDLQMTLASLQRGGQSLGQINNWDQRALFVRAYDEAHHSRNYPIVTPEGGFGDTATNDDGSPSNIGWGSFNEINKALSMLDNDDLASRSRLLGANHKVRSFYNNIISPNSDHGDTTIDTHAINAAHLRPMGGSHPVVDFGLGTGGSSSNATGSKGGYGIYHEAYRRAAERLSQRPGRPVMLPRQLQSITWEAVRGLFTPEQKRDTGLVADVNAIWRQARDGRISADDARNMIRDRANGINAPFWHTPPPTPDEEPQE